MKCRPRILRRWEKLEINGTTITLPRGDSGWVEFPMYTQEDDDSEAVAYTLKPGDKCYFAVKKDYEDTEPVIYKLLDKYYLHLLPQDTEGLEPGTYYYDVHIVYADGERQTYIRKAILKLDKEVHTQ